MRGFSAPLLDARRPRNSPGICASVQAAAVTPLTIFVSAAMARSCLRTAWGVIPSAAEICLAVNMAAPSIPCGGLAGFTIFLRHAMHQFILGQKRFPCANMIS